MMKLPAKFFITGLGVLTFSLRATPIHAQTCITPPSCSEIGFTKTVSDCAGKTVLRCPFDQAQVYCPGYEESSKTYNLGDTYLVNDIAIGKVIEVSDCSTSNTDDITVAQCLANSGCPNYTVTGNSLSTFSWICIGNNKLIATCTTNDANNFALTCNYKGGGNKGCRHGVIAAIGMRNGTFAEATKYCSELNTGGLTWYLPSHNQAIAIYNNVTNFSGYVWNQTHNCSASTGETGFKSDGNCGGDKYGALCQSYFCIAAF